MQRIVQRIGERNEMREEEIQNRKILKLACIKCEYSIALWAMQSIGSCSSIADVYYSSVVLLSCLMA